MTKLILGAAVLIALNLPAGAQAHTTIVAQGRAPYQRWIDEAKVPTPDVSLVVIETATPCEVPNSAGCTDQSSFIELDPDPTSPGFTQRAFLHEEGHVFDRQVLSEGDRAAFASLLRRDGAWEPWLNEKFADAYMRCALPTRLRPRDWPELNGPALPRACALIREAI